MTDQPRDTTSDDDTEGHLRGHGRADAEAAEGDDTEGHARTRFSRDTEAAEDDDEGHHVEPPRDQA